jgi:Domain of unknown function (DUF4259)
MGAWGTGIFDNDTACDWAYELEGQRDLGVIERTLDTVLEIGDGYLEASESEEALAAAEALARLQGHWGVRDSYTETMDAWVETVGLTSPPALVRKAQAAIDRILAADSGLAELWAESDEFEAWKAAVAELRGRLRPQ